MLSMIQTRLPTKHIYPLHIPIKSTIIPRHRIKYSYYDQVDHDTNYNKTFYIYFLGYYLNKPIYCYGETYDIDSIEFTLKKTLPFYKKCKIIPIDTRQSGIDKFAEYIKEDYIQSENKVLLKLLPNNINYFSPNSLSSNNLSIIDIMKYSEYLYAHDVLPNPPSPL